MAIPGVSMMLILHSAARSSVTHMILLVLGCSRYTAVEASFLFSKLSSGSFPIQHLADASSSKYQIPPSLGTVWPTSALIPSLPVFSPAL